MLTSPKLIEPFQFVRIRSEGRGHAVSPLSRPLLPDAYDWSVHAVAAPERTRTIPALWRDAVAEGRHWPAYLVEHGDHWHECPGRSREARPGSGERLLALGIRKGDRSQSRQHQSRVVALRLALASVGGGRSADLHKQLAEDARYVAEHSERSPRSSRTTSSASSWAGSSCAA